MTEWTLPGLDAHELFVESADVAFQESCFAYAADGARNHTRALARLEPDTLGNAAFFHWYSGNIFASDDLCRLIELKTQARDDGFIHDIERVRLLSLGYLRALAADLVRRHHNSGLR